MMANAYSIQVHGIVQGVGFRPFVYRLACAYGLKGWVRNGQEGVEIRVEGREEPLQSFLEQLKMRPPAASRISSLQVETASATGFSEFSIQASGDAQRPTVRISPDLPVCEDCLQELFDPPDGRFHYPYINCTHCGPRYSVVRRLPYDRANTTMDAWPMDRFCVSEYEDPGDRRFHAQPLACPRCGPRYVLRPQEELLREDEGAIAKAASYLTAGKILAVKGLGGYHLVCDARNVDSVASLRTRKYRKEKPFALMAKSIEIARELVELTPEGEELLTSPARPIVLARTKVEMPGVAPGNDELGVMLPYTPLHYLLFAFGAPDVLVMTSANRSSEPIAYVDERALESLSGIADIFLVGERPIARRVDDSVVRAGVFGPAIVRRSRGYAPSAVATLPTDRPILALGADLKNAITLVIGGQAFVSQHIGDLDHYECFRAFRETVEDLTSMYEVRHEELLVVCDAHPEYVSSSYASSLDASEKLRVQHHRAHVASVLAERGAWDKHVIGVSFDGTGYGDGGTIWGGEFFAGSVSSGFERVGHLRQALLPGGDAAAAFPVQAAAGFLSQMEGLPDVLAWPFHFTARYLEAAELIRKNVRTFATTSAGRLFDAAAALLGFTREITFEGQAAMWLQQLAQRADSADAYSFPFDRSELDFRPLLARVMEDRKMGRAREEIARAFQRGVADGVARAVEELCEERAADTVVLSGGVFQNEFLLADLKERFAGSAIEIWTNHEVPANDGGISLGQAALAVFNARSAAETVGTLDAFAR
jgi:hydrogenase maturation protein HypF